MVAEYSFQNTVTAMRTFFEQGPYFFFSPCLAPLAWEGGHVENVGPDDLIPGDMMVEEHEGERSRGRDVVFKGHQITYEEHSEPPGAVRRPMAPE